MGLRAASRQAIVRARPPHGRRFATYLKAVEPRLLARPRVHRFAQVPLVGSPDAPSVPLAVWVEGDGDAAERTRASLRAGTREPALVVGGPLADALSRTHCDRLVLVRAGDQLAPLALERLGQAAALAPDAAVITCDDDELDASGRRRAPRMRPGPSPDRWLACDDSGSLLVVARERGAASLRELDRAGRDGWRHELALALAGAAAERHAHVPLLLCHRRPGTGDSPGLAPSAVQRVLGRWQSGAQVETAGEARRVRRALAGEPSVDVIVCSRDQPRLLRRCVSSLLELTAYDRLSVTVVDNGSRTPEALELLGALAGRPSVRVLRDERPFNFQRLNNYAASSSRADVLVFLNDDTEVLECDWLTVLLEEALRPEVGAVAPLLLYGDATIQHAGAAVGLHGYAGHPFAGLRPGERTAFGRAGSGTRNWLAVSAACMMLERRKFDELGGFDESFVVAGGDVELCLRLTAAGYRSLCVPYAPLMHRESRSRGRHIDPGDFVRSERAYGAFRTVGDPFYNPSLTLRETDCSVSVESAR